MRGRALGRGRLVRRRNADGSFVYVGDWTDAAGVRRRKILSTDRRDAERLLAELVSRRDLERVGGAALVEVDELSLAAIQREYLHELAHVHRRSASHVERMRECLQRIIATLHVESVRNVSIEAVDRYRLRRRRSGTSVATINKETAVLRAAINWAVEHRHARGNPLLGLRPLRYGEADRKLRRRALTDDELERLMAAARESDRVSGERKLAVRTIGGGTKGSVFETRLRVPRVPQAPLWIAFLETGARWTELTSVRWADLDDRAATLTLRATTTKNGRSRTIPLRRWVVDELVALRVVHHGVRQRIPTSNDLVFLTPEGHPWTPHRRNALAMLRTLLAAADIKATDARGRQVDLHALRYTYGTRLARANVELAKAQKLLGHSDPKLTANVYVDLEVEDLRSSVDALPELGRARKDNEARISGATSAHPSEGRDVANEVDDTSAASSGSCNGARGGIRTRNPRFTKAVLYR